MDVSINCEHQFVRVKTQENQIMIFGHRRRCTKCTYEELWNLKVAPGPDVSPALGEWGAAPVWLPDYLKHWTR